MAIFDALIDDMASRFGLGSNAAPLVREGLALIAGSAGGISGFLDHCKSAGFTSLAGAWLGSSDPAPMAAKDLEGVVGASALGGIASRLGLGQSVVTTALAYGVPKLIGLLTPNGVAPTTLPTEVTNFLAPLAAQVAPSSIHVHRAAEQPVVQQVAPRRIDVHHDEPAMTRWLWPVLAALGALGLALYFWPTSRTPVAPVAVTTPAPEPAPAQALTPPRLELSNDDGVVHYRGVVHDEETRNSIVNALKAVFGGDKVVGDIGVDLNRAAAPWMVNFRNGIESLKVPGVQAVFDGNSVNLGGVIGDADRDRIAATMKSALGSGLVIGALNDKVGELISGANAKAATALATLKPGFNAADITSVLNQSIVNFPNGSAEVSPATAAFLQSAAGSLKQLGHGVVVEIAGYTDNTGDPAANVALSQQRAEAVRNVLVNAGVDPGMLVAKGYGSANPVASNDLLEGRFRNRRIEYHVLKGTA